jgi:hypothetical protein
MYAYVIAEALEAIIRSFATHLTTAIMRRDFD